MAQIERIDNYEWFSVNKKILEQMPNYKSNKIDCTYEDPFNGRKDNSSLAVVCWEMIHQVTYFAR